jgi:uncharacterized protein YlxW (UPF0749 family)
MPATLPYSPEEARQILALRQRQQEARRRNEVELDAMVASIESARAALDTKIQDYLRQCDQLRQSARRVAVDESSIRYRTFATLQLRMGGAMAQALKRADGGTRLLNAAKARQEEDDRQKEAARVRQEVRQSQRRLEQSLLPTNDDFESLYGAFDDDLEDLINA